MRSILSWAACVRKYAICVTLLVEVIPREVWVGGKGC